MADSISTPFGPMVEPGWVGGAQMPGAPDLFNKFLTGFQVMNNANVKQKQMENAMAMANLKVQQMQHENTMREGYFNLATLKQNEAVARIQADQKWREYKEQEDTRDKDRNYDRLVWDQQMRGYKSDQLNQRKQNEATGVAGLTSDLSNLAGQETSPTYKSDVLAAGSRWAQWAPAAVQNILQNRLNDANVVRDHAKRSVETDLNDFYNNVGRNLGGGNTLNQNVGDWIERYESLPDKMEGGIYGIGSHKTTKKQIIDPATGNVLSEPDVTYLEQLRNQYRTLQQRKASIADPINAPDIGVYSPVPLPTDRSQWQVGHTYYSPVSGQPAQYLGGDQWRPLGAGNPHPQPQSDQTSDTDPQADM